MSPPLPPPRPAIVDFSQWRAARLQARPKADVAYSEDLQERLRGLAVAETTARTMPDRVARYARQARRLRRLRLLCAAAAISSPTVPAPSSASSSARSVRALASTKSS